MAYFYWFTGLAFAVLLAAVLETVASKHDAD